MRVMWITGASRGIGLETAKLAGEIGWQLVLSSRQTHDPISLPDSTWVPCDVTSWEQQEQAVGTILSKYEQLDAVVANAGFGAVNSLEGGDTSEHWRDMVLTNVLGVAYTIRATLPALKETRGQLILVGSAMAHRHTAGSLYAATKYAVHALAESARLELDGTGVRVTMIAPGMTRTAFHKTFPITPLEPTDVAAAVMWALEQPARVDVNEILLRPTEQTL